MFRSSEASAEVALIKAKGGKVWTLPKGLVDDKETPMKTALREVREETGLEASIISEIGESHYWYNIRGENEKCKKTVKFYLMEFVKGDMADHDDEVELADWVSLESASERLTYKGDKAIMNKAVEMIEKRLKKEAGESEGKGHK